MAGAGEIAFAAGTDIGQFRELRGAEANALRRLPGQHLPPDEELIRLCDTSADFRKDMAAFSGQRKPAWRGT